MLSCRANSQSNAAYTSSVDAAATPRSAPRLVSSHHASVASLLAGRSTREMISARARSRSRQAGPSRPRQPERLGLRPHGGHMPVRQRAGHRHRRRGGHERLPLQRAGQITSISSPGRCGQVRQRLVPDRPAVAVGAAQQVGAVLALLPAGQPLPPYHLGHMHRAGASRHSQHNNPNNAPLLAGHADTLGYTTGERVDHNPCRTGTSAARTDVTSD